MPDVPTATVTFRFTSSDLVGSTAQWSSSCADSDLVHRYVHQSRSRSRTVLVGASPLIIVEHQPLHPVL